MRPSSGVRYALERAEETATELVYRGFAHLPASDLALEVRVEVPSGAVRASIADRQGTAADEAARLEQFAARLVRSVTKGFVQGGGQGASPPRKIVRWREAPT